MGRGCSLLAHVNRVGHQRRGFVVSVTSLAGFVVLSCGFLLHEEAQTIDPCADYNTTATTVPATS